MLAHHDVINQLADCAKRADRLVRADLVHGFVVSENDYTSNFTSALRREINSRAIPGVSAHSQVLTPSVEQKTGTDGCIIFRNQTKFKVGLFEAKWPRLSTHVNCWDSIQKSTTTSHFDYQLEKQASYLSSTGYAIWEMFYTEEPYGANPLFPRFGSSCVWHADAFAISSKRIQTKPWTDTELTSLLKTRKTNIGNVVKSICKCKKGICYPTNGIRYSLENLGIKGEVLVIDMDEQQY